MFGDGGLSASESGVTLLGDVLSLVSAILLALRIVLTSNYAQNISEAKLMLGQLVIGTVLLLPGSYLFESPVSYTAEGRFWFALGISGASNRGVRLLGERVAREALSAVLDRVLLLRAAGGGRGLGVVVVGGGSRTRADLGESP